MSYIVCNIHTRERTKIAFGAPIISEFNDKDHLFLLQTGFKDQYDRIYTDGDIVQELVTNKISVIKYGYYQCLQVIDGVETQIRGLGFYIEPLLKSGLTQQITIYPFDLSILANSIVVGDVYTCPHIFRARERSYLKVKVNGFNDIALEEI